MDIITDNGRPAAYNPPIKAPELTPDITCIGTFNCSSPSNAPTCAIPRAAPKAKPIRRFFFLKIKKSKSIQSAELILDYPEEHFLMIIQFFDHVLLAL